MTDSNTAWFAAVENGDLAAMTASLAAGADINAKNELESTALHSAVQSDNVALVHWLCTHGADPSVLDADGENAFIYCGGAEDPRTQVLADTWVAMFGPKARLTQQLFMALDSQDTAAIGNLVAAGIDLNDAGWHYTTPLIYAVSHCPLDIVCLLLDSGADPNVATVKGNMPLHAAFRGPKQGEQKALLLIERGANVNAREASELTPLHFAAEAGYLEAMAALLDHGADPNAKSFLEETPLQAAGKRAKVIELLRARGAR